MLCIVDGRACLSSGCGVVFFCAEQGREEGRQGVEMLVPPLETLDILGSRGYDTNMYKKGA